MSGVTRLGYVGIEASDLAAWKIFGTQILGLQLHSETPGQRLVFRMDQQAQRLQVQAGPADDLVYAGYETPNAEALAALVQRLRAADVEVQPGSAELAASRQVEALYVCRDPDGNRIELYCGPALIHAPFRSEVLRSAFVTGEQGLGHYFLITPQDRQRALDFYVGLLGFKLSDYIRQELAPGVVADAAFLHCNGRHHSLAVAQLPAPKRIHHLMLQVADMRDVGHAYDRCRDLQVPVEMSLGFHPNDEMFSFYATSPSGFAVELGWGGLQVDDSTWQVRSFDRLSEWGHRPVAQPA